jgi:two-component system, sensor histidine kinase ChiS
MNGILTQPTRSYVDSLFAVISRSGADSVRAEKQRPLILAVDDERDVLDFLRVALAGAGYEFAEASSGAQALEMIDQRQPDLLITDVMMAGMTGLELCAQLRLRNDTQHIPIILYSAYPMRHSNVGLYDRAFVKPADLDELIDAIRTLLPEQAD